MGGCLGTLSVWYCCCCWRGATDPKPWRKTWAGSMGPARLRKPFAITGLQLDVVVCVKYVDATCLAPAVGEEGLGG